MRDRLGGLTGRELSCHGRRGNVDGLLVVVFPGEIDDVIHVGLWEESDIVFKNGLGEAHRVLADGVLEKNKEPVEPQEDVPSSD